MSEKNQLQEFLQKRGHHIPTYTFIEKGLDHKKKFQSTVNIYGNQIQSDWWPTKKDSEKHAAQKAFIYYSSNPQLLEDAKRGGRSVISPSQLPATPHALLQNQHHLLYTQRHQHQQQHKQQNHLHSGGFPTTSITTTTTTATNNNIVRNGNGNGISENEDTDVLNLMNSLSLKETNITEYKVFQDEDGFYGEVHFYFNLTGKIEVVASKSSMRFSTVLKVKEALRLEIINLALSYTTAKLQQHQQVPSYQFVEPFKNNQVRSTLVVKKCPRGDDDPTLPQTKSTPRSYQEEFYRRSMRENIICSLPTGLGKTLIGCMTIKRMKELNPTKRIVFLVDRIPLVLQQSDVIEKETGLVVVSGYGDNFKPEILTTHFDVLVVICDIFIKMISLGKTHLAEYSLVVVDEAHHIVKKHPFAVVLRELLPLLPYEQQPKVLGLTASPAGKKDFFSTVLSLKTIEMESRCKVAQLRDKEELSKYIKDSHTKIIQISLSVTEQSLVDFVKLLISHFKLDPSSVQTLAGGELFDSNADDEDVFKRAGSNTNGETITFVCTLIQKIFNYLDFGFFEDSLKEFTPSQFLLTMIDSLPDRSPLKRELYQLYSRANFTSKDIEINKSKLDVALVEIEKLNQTLNGKIKAIVFVQTRECAHTLLKVLDIKTKLEPYKFIKPGVIVGHGSNGGMSTSKQREIIDAFRNEDCNLIVSTSVIEEGFDVPACNVVIRLDTPSTLTALIQSRGRLRFEKSEFIAIVKDNKENKYEEFKIAEQYMGEAIEFLATGSVPSHQDQLIDGTCSKTVEEMIQRCISIGIPMNTNWKIESLPGYPPHQPCFYGLLFINGVCVSSTKGSSKKETKELLSKSLLKSNDLLLMIRNYNGYLDN
eukprot:gene1281-1616_t